MNTRLARRIIILALGGISGGLIGAAIAGRLRVDELDEEITRENLANRLQPEGPWMADDDTKEEPVVGDMTIETYREDLRKTKNNGKPKDQTDYASISKTKKPVNTLAKERLGKTVLDDEVTKDVKEGQNEPYIISLDMFAAGDDRGVHEKLVLTYYAEDDILADELGNKFDGNRDVFFGKNALTKFGNGSGDPDVVYFRNHKTETDYEIVRNPKSYDEVMDGGGKTKKKPPVKPAARNTKKVTKADDDNDTNEEEE